MIVEDITPEEKPQTTQTNQPSHEIGHLSLAQRFNVQNPNSEEEKKLSEIWEYTRNTSGKSEITDLIWEVMHLENQLGTPRYGESRLDRVYRYCKLRRQANIIDSELKSISGL